MNVEITLDANLPELGEGLVRDIGDVAFKVVTAIEAEAKRLIQHSVPGGRTYRRGEINKPASMRLIDMGLQMSRRRQGQVVSGFRFHRASAPGQPPATDTANLVNSMRARRTGKTSAELAINAGHAGLLEFGTDDMAPRPFVMPSIDFVLENAVPTL